MTTFSVWAEGLLVYVANDAATEALNPSYVIEWGDGTPNGSTYLGVYDTSGGQHEYAAPGTYTLTIRSAGGVAVARTSLSLTATTRPFMEPIPPVGNPVAASLVPSFNLGSLDLTAYPYAVEFGTDLGAPENVYDVLLSALADGESVASDRASNREISLTVVVEGGSMHALAEAERALIAETEKARNVLVLNPGDGLGKATAFDTFRVQATLERDDDQEAALVRRYALTIPALPFGRSTALTTTTSTPVVTTPTYTTLWSPGTNFFNSASYGQGVSVPITNTPTAVTVSDPQGTLRNRLAFHKTGNFSMGGNQYLVVEWKATGTVARFGVHVPVILSINYSNGHSTFDDYPVAGLVTDKVLPDGWHRSTFSAPAAGTQGFTFQVENVNSSTIQDLSVRLVQRADSPEGVGSPKQQNVTFTVGGSVRTQGSISVQHASAALGPTIVYTAPLGYAAPALSPYVVTGARATDATAISGKSGVVGLGSSTSVIVGVPASQVRTGRAQLWAYMKSTSAGTYPIEWEIGTVPAGSTVANFTQSGWSTTGTTNVTFAANVWTLVALGEAPSKFRDVGPNGSVKIRLSNLQGGSTVSLDEAWLFVMDDAALTVVDASATSPAAAKRLWVDAPSLDRPQGGVFQGSAADRSDAYYAPTVYSLMDHNFDPAGMSAFIVTANASGPSVTLTHYRRWHTSAAA